MTMAHEKPAHGRHGYRASIDLTGRVLLVCGVGQGLGLEAVRALGECGATVVCLDRDWDTAMSAAAAVGGVPATGDATKRQDVTALVAAIEREHSRLDGIVDIIGGSQGDWVEDLNDDTVSREFALNFTHAYLLTQIASPLMARSGGGTITFVGSIAGLAALPRQAVYGSAKAALQHFVRCAAVELGHLGIRVNCVAPGYIRTPRMIDRFTAETWRQMAGTIPLGRAGEPEDVAGPLLFLSSDLSRFITGQTLVADGGMLLPGRSSVESAWLQLQGRIP